MIISPILPRVHVAAGTCAFRRVAPWASLLSAGAGAEQSLYSRHVADNPFPQLEPGLQARLAEVFDVEGKLRSALQALGRIEGSDVVVVGGEGRCAASLRELGGRVTTCPTSAIRSLPAGSADAAVSCWDGLDVQGATTERRIGALARTLRSGGRLLIVADYGRDDVDRLRTVADPAAHYAALRRRDGWFAAQGFKIRVIHGRWTFDTVEDAGFFLEEAFGEAGRQLAAELRHPRVSHKIVVYHRTLGGG